MNKVIHKSGERGYANHGWLDSYHSFSFAGFYNPNKMNFGVLRVLNDDTIAPGTGFDTHPHKDMEIISIPLEGMLRHEDSMGNISVIEEGDIQVMTAGSGIHHSEYNASEEKIGKFLQIWIFPREKGLKPTYDQISIRDLQKRNELFQIVSPTKEDEGAYINQDAWLFLGEYDDGETELYKIRKANNGAYIFVLEGKIEVEDTILERRDAIGISDTDSITIKAKDNSKFLLMDVPMSL